MNKYISENTQNFIQKNYNIDDFSDFKILGDNENLVFSVKNKVFRLTNFTHRTEKELKTETKLLEILHNEGADVIKIIDIEGFSNKNEIVKKWGTTMGKIHKIISINHDKLDTGNRLEWDEEIIIKNTDELLPTEDKNILNILNLLIDNFTSLEKNNDEYGLVHTDMRPRNFHYFNGKIKHFDFDDISNNWYIFDVPVAIFHETEQFKTKEERTIFMKNFIIHFLEGYLKEKDIKNIYLEKIIDFMHVRLIYAYIDYYKRLKIKGVDSGKEKMLGRRKFIGSFNDFIDISEIKKVIYSFKN